MARVRGSANYIWFEGDLLGQGATGAVYKARHKRTGEVFAVKTFNSTSSMRPLDVQRREFEVMQKINHENIVKLLAIEEESSSRRKVLIMELCTGGSLLTLLEQPANSFGFEEREFFTVMFDVAAGLKYLRDIGIVHRDIKPGNIMLYKSLDGRHIYKLTDFGAARELDEEEQFMSLYGTEEYLYPDMYARAVLSHPTGRRFDANVDLWSLGITLYHVATGNLPFRPYGGRSNRSTMYKITTEKAPGVISGVQHKENGPIEYSKKLPKTCQLKMGAQILVTPLLAGLMESHPERMMTFNQFFDNVHQIKEMKLIHVFSTVDGNLLHIYLNPNDKLAQLQDTVFKQTDIPANKQHLILDQNNVAEIVSPIKPIVQYLMTSENNPALLYCKADDAQHLSDHAEFAHSDLPSLQISTGPKSLSTDYNDVKHVVRILYFIQQQIAYYHHCQDLLVLAVKNYLFILHTVGMRIQVFHKQFISLIEETEKRITCIQVQHKKNVACLSKMLGRNHTAASQLKYYQTEGDVMIQKCAGEFRMLSDKAKEPLDKVKHYYKIVLTQNEQTCQRFMKLPCQERLKCARQIEVLYEETEKTLSNLKSDKKKKSLSRNEEQIHDFEKLRAVSNYENAIRIFQSNCYLRTESLFKEFCKWFRTTSEINQQLGVCETWLSKISHDQNTLSESLNKCQSFLLEMMDSIQKDNTEDEYVMLVKEDISGGLKDTPGISQESLSMTRKQLHDLNSQLKTNNRLLTELSRNTHPPDHFAKR